MTTTPETLRPRASRRVPPARLGAPRHWLTLTVVLFALTLALGFAARAVPALRLEGVDAALNRAATPLLDQLALAADLLDRPPVVAGILVVVFFALLPATGWRRALGACVVTGLGWLTTLAVKAIVAQPRPSASGLSHPLHVSPATLSYPSGHVVFAAALVTGLVLACRRRWAAVTVGAVGAVMVVAVAWARLYVGVHYVSDVVGGMLNGVAGVLLFAGVWNAAFGRGSGASAGSAG